MTIGSDPALCRDWIREYSLGQTHGKSPYRDRQAIIDKRLRSRCRKSSKSFSKEHTWLISMCDERGHAVCAFCQARFRD